MMLVVVIVLSGVLVVTAGAMQRAKWNLAKATREYAEQAQALNKQLGAAKDQANHHEKEATRYKDQLKFVEAQHAQTGEKVQALAAEVMKQNGENILKRVKEQFDHQTKLNASERDSQAKSIESIVKPVGEELANVKKQISNLRELNTGNKEQVSSEIKALCDTTQQLRDVLHSTKKRGTWGETHLENVLKLTGMSKHVDYQSQVRIEGMDKSLQPDVIVNIPKGGKMVIDAKFPLISDITPDTPKKERQKTYASKLNNHIKELGKRDYGRKIDTNIDFTVMYLPLDPILDEAMEAEPDLWENAYTKHNVLIATPGLLIALLKTLAVAWDKTALQEEFQETVKEMGELYDRMCTYLGHIAKMGNQLNSTLNTYNESVGSWNHKVRPSMERLEKAGAKTKKELAALKTIDVAPRTLSLPDNRTAAND